MSSGVDATRPKDWSLKYLPSDFKYDPDDQRGENGVIITSVGKTWAAVLLDGQHVRPGGCGEVQTIHEYVQFILSQLQPFVENFRRSPRTKAEHDYLYEPVPLNSRYFATCGGMHFTGTDCYSIATMIITIICVSAAIAILYTQPCPIF